ncbi:epithelial cell-transforming sequence 2 oncogene-like isoform X2 [Phyllopteryx taeniolatus]|uniref:epithelial cell-transforming sequence 2 oncogene-like isoform X2 n=1 Tax=Phyllopteryx taeniolatus TaxID=161469 RepID=UPI002AD47336|nr:epithelial cell-transforming sequence 2 oncogene-like isoform X2 [Phyllopteryx taeniolatus]
MEKKLNSHTLFSCWTPLSNHIENMQLFEERISLVLHWFDLWTDRQRKHMLHSLLTRCTKPQLRYCRDLLTEKLPLTQADFTAMLPRFLSLYIMSFLPPLDLCSAAQVSWHWRVLSEQDCLWARRCIRQGWFLPYTPGEKEFGAWKNHFISCLNTLDWLTPREAAHQYRTFNQPCEEVEEEEERLKESRMRQMIRANIQEEKRIAMRTRKGWSSSTKLGESRSHSIQSQTTILGTIFRTSGPPGLSLSTSSGLSLEKNMSRVSGPLSNYISRPAPLQSSSIYRHPATCLLLVSNRIPAYELVLSGVKADVIVVLYDHRGTLSALLCQVEGAVSGRTFQRLGLLAPGGTEEIHLFHNSCLSDRTLLTPAHRDFWEKLSMLVAPAEQSGGIDIFSPCAASTSGMAFMQKLAAVTGLKVWAPMGLATGSFQNIFGDWSDGSISAIGLSDPQPGGPALHYISEPVLQGWCRQVQWMEEALGEMKSCLDFRLQQVGLQAWGRALGHSLWERVRLEDLCLSEDLSMALTEGLTVLTKQEEMRPFEFLAAFLTKWSDEEEAREEKQVSQCSLVSGHPQTHFDWRGVIVRELQLSEFLYISRLSALVKAYQEPLTAALNSNRAILSFADMHVVLSPIAQILDLNRGFKVDLDARLQQWGAEQCVGDVCVKLCTHFRVYTNYLNNYTTALSTIDKCRDAKPAFRAFLKRTDRTLATHMLSLQELLLCPVWRIQEYTTLLQALTLHTHDSHPDHTHLSSALNTMQRYTKFIQNLKRNCERDRLLEETQQMIQDCPRLREGNRQLITSQEAALLYSPNDHIPESLRTYEHVADVSLFLFSDMLVLTRRKKQHTPFTVVHRSTHTFLASVTLASLTVRRITHSRYVKHAFILEGPSRSWVCATERGDQMKHFLCVLSSAMQTTLTST